MMRLPILFLSPVLCIAASTPVMSQDTVEQCEVALEPSSQIVRMRYDPFEDDLGATIFNLAISGVNSADCQLSLSIEGRGYARDRVLRNGTSELAYEVSLNGSLLENELGNPQVQLPLQHGASGRTVFALQFRIRQGEFSPSGEYSDELTLRLYNNRTGTSQQIGPERAIVVSALVPARAQVNIAGSNARTFGANPAGIIDFGELRTGAERNAFIQVRSTSPVMLQLSSANGGLLQHSAFASDVLGVPYSVSVGEQEISLASGPVRLTRNPTANWKSRLNNYPLRFRITDATGRVAGIYQDTLTISVEPR